MLKELMALLQGESPLRESFAEAAKMLEQSREFFEQASGLALQGKAPAFDIGARDKEVNRLHQDVRARLLEHLTINPGQELVASLMLLSIIDDIERLGDFCKNIVKIPQWAGERDGTISVGDDLKQVTEKVRESFRLTHEAFVDSEKDKAQKVMNEHQNVRRLCDAIMAQRVGDESVSKSDAVFETFYAYFLKRMSAHLKNISSGVANPFDKIGYTKLGMEEPD